MEHKCLRVVIRGYPVLNRRTMRCTLSVLLPGLYLKDFVICELFSAEDASCTDRSGISTRDVPPLDKVDPDLEVIAISIDGEWTTVTFLRAASATDDDDYDLGEVGGLG